MGEFIVKNYPECVEEVTFGDTTVLDNVPLYYTENTPQDLIIYFKDGWDIKTTSDSFIVMEWGKGQIETSRNLEMLPNYNAILKRWLRVTNTPTSDNIFMFDLSNIKATLIKPPNSVEIRQYITNGVSDYNSEYVEIDTTTQIVFTANSGYVFKSDGMMNIIDEFYTPIISDTIVVNNTNSVTYTLDTSDLLEGYVVEISLEAEEEDIPIPVIEIPFTQNLTHVTSDYTSNVIAIGDIVPITFTASSGYVFNLIGNTAVENEFGTPLLHLNQTITPSGTNTLTFNLDLTEFKEGYTLTLTLEAEKGDVVEIVPYVNLYTPTPQELQAFSQEVFTVLGSDSLPTVTDVSAMLIGSIMLPIPLNSDLIGERSNMRIGKFLSATETTLVNDYKMSVNVGDISVPEVYNNLLDYVDVRCTLFLPFVNSIELSPEYVINQTISIEYDINLYDGSTTINIVSSYTNKIIYTTNDNISIEIPFITNRNYENVQGSLRTSLQNNIRKAYVEVTRNTMINDIENLGVNSVEIGQLDNRQGYFEIDNIKLNSKATYEEKEMIKSMLRNGVFIK